MKKEENPNENFEDKNPLFAAGAFDLSGNVLRGLLCIAGACQRNHTRDVVDQNAADVSGRNLHPQSVQAAAEQHHEAEIFLCAAHAVYSLSGAALHYVY